MVSNALWKHRRFSGAEHAVLAACLSAFVMIIILLYPTIEATVWGEDRVDYGVITHYQDNAISQAVANWY